MIESDCDFLLYDVTLADALITLGFDSQLDLKSEHLQAATKNIKAGDFVNDPKNTLFGMFSRASEQISFNDLLNSFGFPGAPFFDNILLADYVRVQEGIVINPFCIAEIPVEDLFAAFGVQGDFSAFENMSVRDALEDPAAFVHFKALAQSATGEVLFFYDETLKEKYKSFSLYDLFVMLFAIEADFPSYVYEEYENVWLSYYPHALDIWDACDVELTSFERNVLEDISILDFFLPIRIFEVYNRVAKQIPLDIYGGMFPFLEDKTFYDLISFKEDETAEWGEYISQPAFAFEQAYLDDWLEIEDHPFKGQGLTMLDLFTTPSLQIIWNEFAATIDIDIENVFMPNVSTLYDLFHFKVDGTTVGF